jgi:hypothetical protein
MNRIFITCILFSFIYCYRLRRREPLTELSDNMLVSIYIRKENFYISRHNTEVRTSQALRANEQFRLIKSNNFWCFEHNNNYISIDATTCPIEDRENCANVKMSNECGENEQFEIINKADVGKEFFTIRNVKHDLYLSIKELMQSLEAIGNRGIVIAQSEPMMFEFMNATLGHVI